MRRAVLAAAAIAVLASCGARAGGSTGRTETGARVTAAPRARAARVPDGDWATFDFDAARSGSGPAATGIGAREVARLRRRVVHIDGVADSSPVQLHAVRVGRFRRDVAVVTTTYGRTIAFDPGSGARLWQFAPRDIGSYEGSNQITTASPVADPDRRFVYAAGPDGYVRKLALRTGHQLWAARVTADPRREKLGGALNLSGRYVIAVTGGYFGDAPTYEGHVAMIDRATGRVAHVWNADCSGVHHLLDPPSSCRADTTFGGSAIWSRSGAVVEPGSRRLLVATGNGPFNGSTDWGDSVLELSPDAGALLHNWTPSNQAQLNAHDTDLGSTEPALLGGGLAVQGGKDGILRLLDLPRLDGGTGGPGPRTGGELQRLGAPGPADVFTAPAVWRGYVFVADGAGTAAYRLAGRRLTPAWQNGNAGTSPVVAGGLLYVYDPAAGKLRVYGPARGRELAALPAAAGHWSSPIVVGGRVLLPVGGSTSDNARSGVVFVYHLPGR